MKYVGITIILLAFLIIGCSSTNAERLTLDAFQHIDEGRIEEALPLFEDACRKQPENPEYLYNLLYAKLQNKEFESVIEKSGEAFMRHPLYLEFLYLKARAQRELNRTDAAIATYREIARLNPGDVKALALLLSEAATHGLQEEAVYLAQVMLDADPSNMTALKTLAEADPSSWFALVYAYLMKEDPASVQ